MKRIASLGLCLVLVLSLCGCGTVPSAKSAPAYETSYYAANSTAMYDVAEMEEAAVPGLAMGRAAAADAGPEAGAGSELPAENPEKIIYSADVTVESTAFDEALGKVAALVERFGGWIESSSVNGANFYDLSRGRSYTRSASYTLRIPGDRFEEIMGSLSEIGNVPYTHIYTENVSAQYYDTQAHMTAYQTQEARLLEMMEAAESVEDIILLEDRLTELRYRIESLQSTLLNWDRRVTYSTVYLQLNEVREYTEEPPVQLRYGERLVRALRDGLSGVGRFFQNFLLWFAEALPTLVILAVLALILTPLIRRLHRRRKARREARKAAKTDTPSKS